MKDSSVTLIQQYKKLGFKLTHIPTGQKGPTHNDWNIKPTKYKSFTNGTGTGTGNDSPLSYNIGLLHSLSGYVCFDIDNIEEMEKLPDLAKILAGGLHYTSGKPNRVKILFRIPPGVKSKIFITKTLRASLTSAGFGQLRCCSANGDSVQDVLPPSVLGDGRQYEWLDELPTKRSQIPVLPKSIVKQFKKQYKTIQKYGRTAGGSSRYSSKLLAPYVQVYNTWYLRNNKNIADDILAGGGYVESSCGRGFNRVGSSSGSVNIRMLSDSGGDYGYNFSDSAPDNIDVPVVFNIGEGAFDPYDLLVAGKFNGIEADARKWVCTHEEMSSFVDTANDILIKENTIVDESGNTVDVPKLRMDGILFDESKKNRPYLDMSVMMPGNNMFSELVESILYHQQGVYNPDMAFWYSLVFADYLIGCGYGSIGGNSCEPIYVFTAGDSSDGKTVTMNAGNEHLMSIGATGNSVVGAAVMEQSKESKPTFSSAFENKKHLKNVKTAEGLEDLITIELNHGCDVLFTQDEYGLKENGTMDNAARNFRATILDYKTLSRSSHVEPRLLASKMGSGKHTKKRGTDTYCVHFNYFTTATDTTLKGVIRDEEVGQGYIQRFVGGASRSPHFRSRVDMFGSRSWNKNKISVSLKKCLMGIVTVGNRNTGFARSTGGHIKVKITSDASAYLDELHRVCILSVDPMTAKMIENIQPIAKVAAIFKDSKKPTVNLAMIQWAHTICSCSVLYFRYLLDKLRDVGKNKDLVIEEIILSYMTENGAIDKGSAVSRLSVISGTNMSKKGFSSMQYGPVWDVLISLGLLGSVTKKVSSGQKKTTYYVVS